MGNYLNQIQQKDQSKKQTLMDGRNVIQVTEPFLPPYEDYQELLSGVWNRNWLTNNGPLIKELELRLSEYLDLKNLCMVNNGTIALQFAIKVLDLQGEIITTPFSYVATTSSIFWEGCTPVFADIDPFTFNLDPGKIEAAITSRTTGILATHVFGNPCDIEAIKEIADHYQLKIIYDAAHAFGSTYKGRSVFHQGDVSVTSFHATKLFHTIEGGAVVADDPELIKRIKLMRNFGHNGPEKFLGVGINGKNSEVHAAMGLCNLKYVDQILDKRRTQCNLYRQLLAGNQLQFQAINSHCDYNHAYFPILFKNEKQLLSTLNTLNVRNIFPRRYFYPSLTNLDYVSKYDLPIAESIAERILCLPLYHRLTNEEIELISSTITNSFG